jgi:nitrite reductase (cytochrome c-552)
MPLTFPWGKGLTADNIEAFWDEKKFPNGEPFVDYAHAETGAPVLKAQHPEFELWNQGIHARSGVSCADCHMPYMREGASKVSDHWVRSPLLNVNRACQTCHRASEEEMKSRVDAIQQRNYELLQRGGAAIVDLIDALVAAKAAGAPADVLDKARKLQRKAQWRLDFIAAENSMGFHAPQEAAKVLGEAVDYARQGQIALLGGRATAAAGATAEVSAAAAASATPSAAPSASASPKPSASAKP